MTSAMSAAFLARRVVALLMLQYRERLDRAVPTAQAVAREIAVDPSHVGLAELDDLVEDRLCIARRGVVRVDEHRETVRLSVIRHGGLLGCAGHFATLVSPVP